MQLVEHREPTAHQRATQTLTCAAPLCATAEAMHEKEERLRLRQQRAPKSLDNGGGMFLWERAWFALRGAVARARQALGPKPESSSSSSSTA